MTTYETVTSKQATRMYIANITVNTYKCVCVCARVYVKINVPANGTIFRKT